MEQDVITYKNAALANRQPAAGDLRSTADEAVIKTSQLLTIIRPPMAGDLDSQDFLPLDRDNDDSYNEKRWTKLSGSGDIPSIQRLMKFGCWNPIHQLRLTNLQKLTPIQQFKLPN